MFKEIRANIIVTHPRVPCALPAPSEALMHVLFSVQTNWNLLLQLVSWQIPASWSSFRIFLALSVTEWHPDKLHLPNQLFYIFSKVKAAFRKW